ncbi:MFS sugar transporter [Pseudohyphozyma bogoriensis]|nr:MFS sugar transporter [Pseudohyphozyma bogoriensis]
MAIAAGESNVRDAWKHIPNALTTGGQRWWKNAGVRKLNFFITIVFCGQFLNGIDDNLISGFQALPSWRKDLGNPSQSAIGLLSSSAYIAGLLTAPVAGYVADRWGRRWCIRWSALCALVGALIGCLAGINDGGKKGYNLFLVSRLVYGSGVNYAVASFLLAWYLFGMSYLSNNSWAWRSAYLLQILPAIWMGFWIQFVPESPRWLLSKGRAEEALSFLVKYHGNGDPTDELVLFEFEEMKEQLRVEKEFKQDSWKTFVSTKGNRHRIAIVMLIVICQNLSGSAIAGGYYTQVLDLVGITSSTAQTGINAGLTGTVVLGALFGSSIVDKVPRRKMLLSTWTVLLLIMIGTTITSARYTMYGDLVAGKANVAMVFLFLGTFFIVCGPLFFSYQTECLSYSVRAKGMIIWGISNKIISIFNAYVNSIALGRIGWKYYIVYCVLNFLQLTAMYFLLVETKGYTLEEIAVMFDGENTAHVEVAPYEQGLHHDEKDGQPMSSVKEAESDA